LPRDYGTRKRLITEVKIDNRTDDKPYE
jgi:hypothetical protein